MYQQDWLIRQIQILIQFITRIAFKKDAAEYQIDDFENLSQADSLYIELEQLLADGEICKAEDLLFENLRNGNYEHLKLALAFYQKLNQLDDTELENASFSREEINVGLNEIIDIFKLPKFMI